MVEEILAPQINPNDQKVELVKWLVSEGEFVKKDQEIAQLSSSKSTVAFFTEKEGYISFLQREGHEVPIGAPLARIAESRATLERKISPGAEVQGPASLNFGGQRLSRKMKELVAQGVAPLDSLGSGLISARHFFKTPGPAAPPPQPAMIPAPPKPNPDSSLRYEGLSSVKRAEISALEQGNLGVIRSSLTVGFSAEKLLSKITKNCYAEETLLPFILFELAALLDENPLFTSYFQDGRIFFHDRVAIGLAIDLTKGLKVVSLGNLKGLMPIHIYERCTDIALRYFKDEIKIEELVSSTFTVSDLSSENILQFDPLINARQAAILGIGADKGEVGKPFRLTLSFDHRILTGRQVAAFLNELKGRILAYESV